MVQVEVSAQHDSHGTAGDTIGASTAHCLAHPPPFTRIRRANIEYRSSSNAFIPSNPIAILCDARERHRDTRISSLPSFRPSWEAMCWRRVCLEDRTRSLSICNVPAMMARSAIRHGRDCLCTGLLLRVHVPWLQLLMLCWN